MTRATVGRPPRWPLAVFFGLFLAFLYGPLVLMMVLSFQGPNGGLTLPMQEPSLHWFRELLQDQLVGDFKGAFFRSFRLALMVMITSVCLGVLAGQAMRSRFRGSSAIFYLSIAAIVVPHILVSLGIGVMFSELGLPLSWYTSGFGAHLTWTLPFALLIMLAVFNRFPPNVEDAARDCGANEVQVFRDVVLPLAAPGLVGVALFSFILSYDEYARSSLVTGPDNTLPLEIFAVTTNLTSPVIYAIGTVTTIFSLLLVGLATGLSLRSHRRRSGSAKEATGT